MKRTEPENAVPENAETTHSKKVLPVIVNV